MRTGPGLESRPKAPRVWILTHGSGSRKRVLDQQPVRQVGRRGPSEPLPEGEPGHVTSLVLQRHSCGMSHKLFHRMKRCFSVTVNDNGKERNVCHWFSERV